MNVVPMPSSAPSLETLLAKRPEFPIDCLTPLLRDAVRAIADITDAPLGLCANSVLAATSLAVQGHFDVVMPQIDEPRPLSLYLLTVAESGERKTAADTLATCPVKYYEREILWPQHKADRQQFDHAMRIYAAQEKLILTDRKLSLEEKHKQIFALGLKPEPPLSPIICVDEPTIAGLETAFHQGRPSLGLFNSEGGSFVGGFAMSKDQRLGTAAALSKFWDGDAPKRTRADPQDSYALFGRRLSMNLMLQPGIAVRLFAMEDLREQGLFSRCLTQFPESRMGQRFHHELHPESKVQLRRYGEHFYGILQQPLPIEFGERQVLRPGRLSLAPDALALWIEFKNKMEKLMLGRYSSIRGFANKVLEHSCRIAAAMASFEAFGAYSGSNMMIAGDVFQRACTIAQHYADHLLTFTGSASGLSQ